MIEAMPLILFGVLFLFFCSVFRLRLRSVVFLLFWAILRLVPLFSIFCLCVSGV